MRTNGLHAIAVATVALAASHSLAQLAQAGQCGNTHVSQQVLNLLPDGAATVTAVQSGAWSDPDIWGGQLPGPGDDVLIPQAIAVTYDIDDDGDGIGNDTTRFHFVRVDGVLTWATSQNTTMYVDTLLNSPTGEILIGEENAPIPSGVTANIFIIADDPLVDAGQLSRGLVLHGRNRIVGAEKTAFAALAGDANAGSTSLTLQQAPTGWNIGDTLVLGGTWFDPAGTNDDNSRFHDEVLTITAINGAQISFTNTAPGSNGLQWDHERPGGTHFSANDLTLYVANLTRNITFQSELDPASPDAPTVSDPRDMRRAHHMVMHTPDSVTMHAAFYDFGRLTKNRYIDDEGTNIDGTPGVGANVRGRYAFHHHRNLPQNNVPLDPFACEPAHIEGCVVWGSPGWGFVHHDSYCVFQDNVAFDVLGAAFVQEAGNEIGLWQGNLSIKTTGDDDPELTVEPFGDGFKRVTNFDFGFNGEAYWIQGACQVALIDNIAISAAGGGANIFADVDGNENRDRGFVPAEHLPADIQYIVTNEWGLIAGNRVPANTFTGFEVYNSDFGLLTWNHMRNQGEWVGFICPCDGNTHREYSLIDNFTFWNIYGQGVHLQYSSQIEFRNGLIASSDMATPGIDDKPFVDLKINGNGRGYGLGMNGPTKRLIVDNVIIEGWEFGLRTPIEGRINGLDNGNGTGSDGALGLADRRSVFRNLRMANNGDHMYRKQNNFSASQTFANHLVIEDCQFAGDVPNDPPTAAFSYVSQGPHGIVKLSGAEAVDLDTPNGPAYFEAGVGWVTNASVAVEDPNYIVAYGWDLNNDGSIDRFGETIIEQFPIGQSTPVTLTVWDHQGAKDTVTANVSPHMTVYPELIVDGGFDVGAFNNGTISSGTTNAGWFSDRATIEESGVARLAGEWGFAWVGQAVFDDFARRGLFTLSYDYAISEGHDDPSVGQVSRLQVRVWGINTEFTAQYREFPVAEGAVPFEADLLHEQWFHAPTDWTNVQQELDFGDDGHLHYMISFRAVGVDSAVPNDHVLLDNISIIGAEGPCSPADINGDGLINVIDLLRVITCWGEVGDGCNDADFITEGNDLGVVNVSELLAVISEWGACGEAIGERSGRR